MKLTPLGKLTPAANAAVRELVRSEPFRIAQRIVFETFKVPIGVVAVPTLEHAIAYGDRFQPFCSCIRSIELGNKRCNACDRKHIEYVLAHGETIFYHCHAGMANTYAPVRTENEIVTLLCAGQVLDHPPTEDRFLSVWRRLRDLGISKSNLRKAYFATTVLSREHIQGIMALIQLNAQFVVDAELRIRQFRQNPAEEVIHKVQEFCEKEHARPLRLREIAKHVHLSPTHLSRLFRQKTGQCLFDFLTQVRLQEAKHFLWATDRKVADIAYATGFRNARYFSYIFRSKTHLTPTAYRRTLSPKGEH